MSGVTPSSCGRVGFRSVLLVAALLLSGCLGFSHPGASRDSRAFLFESGGNTLAATLNLPRSPEGRPPPLLVFVHGDGALPADAYGYYAPIWNHLARRGIASAAWDKPGVGASSGNWLHQSMEERAQEVVDAVAHLRSSVAGVDFSSIGLIGFSQAGWVLPEVAASGGSSDFLILVSGAIHWKRQSDYLTRRRLEREGRDSATVEAALAQNRLGFALFEGAHDYDDYLRHEREKCRRGILPSGCDPMSSDRYRFVRTNIDADASEALARIDQPVLALFGDRDANVDVDESRATYRRLVPTPPRASLHVETYADAAHGLLRVEHFDGQDPGFAFLLKLGLMGEDAFADGVLDDIAEFALDPSTAEDVRER